MKNLSVNFLMLVILLLTNCNKKENTPVPTPPDYLSNVSAGQLRISGDADYLFSELKVEMLDKYIRLESVDGKMKISMKVDTLPGIVGEYKLTESDFMKNLDVNLGEEDKDFFTTYGRNAGIINIKSIDRVNQTLTGTFDVIVGNFNSETKKLTGGFKEILYIRPTRMSMEMNKTLLNLVLAPTSTTTNTIYVKAAEKNSFNTFYLNISKNISVNTYTLPSDDISISFFKGYSQYRPKSGEKITITEHDTKKKIIKGNFNVILENTNNPSDIISITNAKFDCQYQ